jgi:hypothetical protein
VRRSRCDAIVSSRVDTSRRERPGGGHEHRISEGTRPRAKRRIERSGETQHVVEALAVGGGASHIVMRRYDHARGWPEHDRAMTTRPVLRTVAPDMNVLLFCRVL